MFTAGKNLTRLNKPITQISQRTFSVKRGMSSFAQSQFNDTSGTPRPQDVSVEGVERILNLSAGNAPLYTEVMQQAQKEMLNWKGKGISVMEMGYRTKNFHEIMHNAE